MTKVYDFPDQANNNVLLDPQPAGGETQSNEEPEAVHQSFSVCDFLKGDPTAPEYHALRNLFRQHLQASSNTPSLLAETLSNYSEEIKILLAQIEIESQK